jgi:anti-sigma B factor antagonist
MAGVIDRAEGTEMSGPPIAVAQALEPSGAVVLTVTGEVDLASVATLQAAVDQALALQPPELAFELSGLRFMDSSGIAVLLHAAAQTGRVQVRNPSAVVRRVIELTGLTGVLHLTP